MESVYGNKTFFIAEAYKLIYKLADLIISKILN